MERRASGEQGLGLWKWVRWKVVNQEVDEIARVIGQAMIRRNEELWSELSVLMEVLQLTRRDVAASSDLSESTETRFPPEGSEFTQQQPHQQQGARVFQLKLPLTARDADSDRQHTTINVSAPSANSLPMALQSLQDRLTLADIDSMVDILRGALEQEAQDLLVEIRFAKCLIDQELDKIESSGLLEQDVSEGKDAGGCGETTHSISCVSMRARTDPALQEEPPAPSSSKLRRKLREAQDQRYFADDSTPIGHLFG